MLTVPNCLGPPDLPTIAVTQGNSRPPTTQPLIHHPPRRPTSLALPLGIWRRVRSHHPITLPVGVGGAIKPRPPGQRPHGRNSRLCRVRLVGFFAGVGRVAETGRKCMLDNVVDLQKRGLLND